MIIVQDLFNTLAHGAYANTGFVGTDGLVKEIHYPKVAGLINLGILEIYKRFKFLENELFMYITPLTTNYYLRPDRVAPSNALTEVKYIEESTTDGFLNIVKVIGAYDSNANDLFRTHETDEYNIIPTVKLLSHDSLQITNISVAQIINIVYQSYPTKIATDDCLDPETAIISIPEIIIDPLLSFVAAKTFKPMGANDSTANADKSSSYEQQYELACQKLALYGLAVHDTTERDTFDNNGWV